MKITIKKTEIIQYLLSIVFLLNLFISEISNYKPYSFYLKGLSSIILLLLTWIDYKFNNVKFVPTNQIKFKTFSTALFLFILIPVLSLVYSGNIEFGIKKIGYLLISVGPSILVFLYFLISTNSERQKIFLNSTLFVGLLFAIFSLILSPYNQTIGYSFELSRWSHVIAGRFLSSIIVIVLLLHFSEYIKSKVALIIATIILLVSIYFIGMRAAFLGIIITIIFMLLYAIIQKKQKALISISITLLFATISIFLIAKSNTTSTDRYNQLKTNESGKFDDGAINARLIAYNASLQNIKEHPILGVGIGGFYNHEISGDIAEIKYPHNLLIEIQLELGIFGTIFFGILLALIFWKSYKYSIPLFIFFLFSFWLAMFSKDITTQTQLWIGIALLGIKGKD